MSEIRIPYRVYPSNPHPAFPDCYTVAMPMIPVVLRVGSRTIGPIELLADSGADHCIVSIQFGRDLGLNIETGIKAQAHGLENISKDVWFHKVEMEVEGRGFECKCAFGDLGGLSIPGILGRNGFFNRFSVIFEQRNHSVVLKYRDDDLLGHHQ